MKFNFLTYHETLGPNLLAEKVQLLGGTLGDSGVFLTYHETPWVKFLRLPKRNF